MTRRPTPGTLADLLETVARTLRTKGHDATQLATQLAARGWPTTTLRTGPAGGNSDLDDDGHRIELTSVERAAANPGPWAGIDERGDELYRAAWRIATDLDAWHTQVLAHGSDDDPLPAGSGTCAACGDFVRADGNKPTHNIRGGLCGACRTAKSRLGIIDRDDFIARRRADLAQRASA